MTSIYFHLAEFFFMLREENRIQNQTFDLLGSNKASDNVLFINPEFLPLPVEVLEAQEMKDLAQDLFFIQVKSCMLAKFPQNWT